MIVLTTPTGTIGSTVVTSLLGQGAPLRLVVRDPARLPATVQQRCEVVTGSHSDPDVLDAALLGADAMFVLVPPDHHAADVTGHYLDFARPIADAVRAHGVPRLVAVSSLGRGFTEPAGVLTAAWAMDDVLETSGAAYRSVQPPFFMENLLHQVGPLRDTGRFELPADPDAAFPMVATDDVARTVASLLLDTTWQGHDGVVVREPDDRTPRAMARVMSEALRRPVEFDPVTAAAYGEQFAAFGASPAVVAGMTDMAAAQTHGVYPAVEPGGTGTTFEQWCADVLAPAVAGEMTGTRAQTA